jgi:DNA adenine methylase
MQNQNTNNNHWTPIREAEGAAHKPLSLDQEGAPGCAKPSLGKSEDQRLTGIEIDNGGEQGAKPFLKWAGGKSQLWPQLHPLIPSVFGTYFEPFLGGGAVYFKLQPSRAVLNDINPALIAAYGNIRGQSESVVTTLRRLRDEFIRGNEEERERLFYRIRERYNVLPVHAPLKTAYLIFLNKTCFNGLYRENGKGEFNVPFGRYKNPAIFDEDGLRSASTLLQTANLTALPFENAVDQAGKGDFIYFDPPYHPLNATSNFTSYHAQDFSEPDQIRLRDCFVNLHQRGCLVMLSNSCCDFIRDLYKAFSQHAVTAKRAINCKAERRGEIAELVITNYTANVVIAL